MFSKQDLERDPREASSFFKRNGFIHIKNFYDKKLCENCISIIQVMEKNLLEEQNKVSLVTEMIEGKVYVKYYQGVFALDSIYRKFLNLELLSLGSLLLQTKNIFFADLEAHIRNPGGGEIPKHQDNFYFNLKNSSAITAYIALSSHDKQSGGLNYKVNSHKQVLEHDLSEIKGFSSYITEDGIEKNVGDARTYSPSYDVGDITIHHCNNIHWSDACPTLSPRGYALSARMFNSNDSIDPKGVQRYQKLLSKNRLPH